MTMTDRTQIDSRSPVDRRATATGSSRVRSRTTNAPADRLGRTAEARRVRDLYAGYSKDLGAPTDVSTQALILACAEAMAVAEKARADYLAGRSADLNGVIRAENTANRALKRLGLAKPSLAPRKSLLEKMTDKEAAQRAGQARIAARAVEGAERPSLTDQLPGEAGTQLSEATE